MPNEPRVPLTYDQAVERLADGPKVHAVRNVGLARIVADWPRDKLLTLIAEKGCEETGPIASRHGYGIALMDDRGWLFIATKPEATTDAR